MTIIYVLLVAHFVGDFLCQSDWMAINKSKLWDALALHVVVYSAVLFSIVWLALGLQPNTGLDYAALGVFINVNAVAHFVQDAITSRITARLWFFKYVGGGWIRVEAKHAQRAEILCEPWEQRGGNRHWFFVAIGADQLLHYVTLFVTAGWWLR